MKNIISTVNYHFWKPCNMRCKFCYATFQDIPKDFIPVGHLSLDDSKLIVDQVASYGFKKINFAGGEPTLCPWLPELVMHAKRLRLETSIVTNGWTILQHKDYLDKFSGTLDIVGLSMDSIFDLTNLQNGRAQGRKVITGEEYRIIADRIKQKNIYLKVNTVVTRYNVNECLSTFMNRILPRRWKILQVLAIEGQNDGDIDSLLVSNIQFKQYVDTNTQYLNRQIEVVVEDNNTITGSYIMIDPVGRFFDNTNGTHTYSFPILSIGIEKALQQVKYDAEKFISRGGQYDHNE